MYAEFLKLEAYHVTDKKQKLFRQKAKNRRKKAALSTLKTRCSVENVSTIIPKGGMVWYGTVHLSFELRL